MMNKKLIAGVCSVGLLFAGTAFADGREDYYTQLNQQQYFNMPENARTVGMAGSSVVTSSDSSSTIGNPAGLGFMKDADVSVSYYRDQMSGNEDGSFSDILQETDGGHALAAFPIVPHLDGTPKYGTIGFGWSGGKGDTDDSLDTEARNWGLHLGYGKDISDKLSLGYGVGYIQKKFTVDTNSVSAAAKMDDGVLQTVGAQYKLSDKTTLGFDTFYGFGSYNSEVAINDTTALTGDEDVNSWGAEWGVAHTMGATTLSGSMDYTSYNSDGDDDSNAWGFKSGVEQSVTDWLKARAGVRYQANFGYDLGFENDNAKYMGAAFGAGVKLAKNLFADYGAEYRHIGDGSDWLHSVTLSVPFSLCVN